MVPITGPSTLSRSTSSLVSPRSRTSLRTVADPHPFSGGFLPSVTCLVDSINTGSKGKLLIEQIENIGPRASPRSLLPPSFADDFAQITLARSGNGVVGSRRRSRRISYRH